MGKSDPDAVSLRARTGTPAQAGIRALVLLAGRTPGSLAALVERSVLDLPIGDSLRLLDVWETRIAGLLAAIGADNDAVDVHVLCGETDPLPLVRQDARLRFRVERDGGSFRGTAGVLRDISERFAPGDCLLVGVASQCPGEGMLEALAAAADWRAGVSIGVDPAGVPNGLMLVRCEALGRVAPVGYIDFKEQALPKIAAACGARVVVAPQRCAPPIRDLARYIDAIRSWRSHRTLEGVRFSRPFEEHWTPQFSIIEAGAAVSPSALILDSVVLAGGVVAERARVVRSVVGPRGRVSAGRTVVDRLVTDQDSAQGRRPDPLRGPS